MSAGLIASGVLFVIGFIFVVIDDGWGEGWGIAGGLFMLPLLFRLATMALLG